MVSWSISRILLTLVLQEGRTDYYNALVQAELTETVFVDPPKLFGNESGKRSNSKLLKSYMDSNRHQERSLKNSRLDC